jgi:protein gp37
MHPDWARSLRDQCAAADVPFFFKQWGEFGPDKRHPQLVCYLEKGIALMPDGEQGRSPQYHGATWMARVGKSRAGRLLDGRQHNDMPEVRR